MSCALRELKRAQPFFARRIHDPPKPRTSLLHLQQEYVRTTAQEKNLTTRVESKSPTPHNNVERVRSHRPMERTIKQSTLIQGCGVT